MTDDVIDFMQRRCAVKPRPYIVDLAKSHGSILATTQGDLLDLACFHGSRLIGYNHPKVMSSEIQTALAQAATIKPSNPDFVTAELYAYYRTLERIAPRCIINDDMRIFVVNSGAEAVENAFKHCIAKTSGTYFISFTGGFHGRTVFNLANTHMPHNPSAHTTFSHFAIQSTKIRPPSCEDDVMRAIEDVENILKSFNGCAGIIIEPIQGAGGHVVIPASFIRALNAMCHAYKVPMIIDEVQTGGGASGSMWMSDLYDLQFPPECIVGGKRLGCGVVYMHTSASMGLLDTTWGGTLVDMVRVCAEINVVESENLMEQVSLKHSLFLHKLLDLSTKYPRIIAHPRGVGLLLGFDVEQHDVRNRLIDACLDNKLLVLPAGLRAIRFRPDLSITFNDINDAIHRLTCAIETTSSVVQAL